MGREYEQKKKEEGKGGGGAVVDFEGARSMSKDGDHDQEGCYWETQAWGMGPRAMVRGSGRGVGERRDGAMGSRRELAA